MKTNWFIILFLIVGYFAFLSFDQGQDILRTLGFARGPVILRQTFFVYLAVSWWSWQSFRASRVLLHFSYFNFWSYRPSYSLQAQVIIPRLLAAIPYILLGFGILKATGRFTPMVWISLSSAFWIFIFLHYRKQLIVWIRARKPIFHGFVPDYIPIKNGTYPAAFIWSKQRRWILFRLGVVAGFFLLMFLFPVDLPQYVGSAAIVLFAFGCWLIIAALVMFGEKFLRFPISFSVLVCLVLFSFFNNNHEINTLNSAPDRPLISAHFDQWIANKKVKDDSIDVYLVMAEGGGMRSAYWTSGVLRELEKQNPGFLGEIYAFSSVSGGSLGTVLATSLMHDEEVKRNAANHAMLQHDFLAPVTASLTFNDMLQRFIPIPIRKFDRMGILERSWEEAWQESKPAENTMSWEDGFVSTFSSKNYPLIMLNSTHVESGARVLVSNARVSEIEGVHLRDFFEITERDVSISTAVGASSRFPFLTPPALMRKPNGNVWGSLVDGGYYENLGARTILDVYSLLKKISKAKGYNIRFNLVAIRNTKISDKERPVHGLYEIVSPMITFSNIWANTGDVALQDAKRLLAEDGDKLFEIHLLREDSENIPLGWFLSETARENIDMQLKNVRLDNVQLPH